MTLAEATLAVFTAFSTLRLVSYWPQIYKVASDTNGASAISYSTWILWTCNNLATSVYAVVNLDDRLLAACSALYAVCCISVIVLTAFKRQGFRMRATPAE